MSWLSETYQSFRSYRHIFKDRKLNWSQQRVYDEGPLYLADREVFDWKDRWMGIVPRHVGTVRRKETAINPGVDSSGKIIVTYTSFDQKDNQVGAAVQHRYNSFERNLTPRLHLKEVKQRLRAAGRTARRSR